MGIMGSLRTSPLNGDFAWFAIALQLDDKTPQTMHSSGLS